ncbi:hypothetical protein [Polaromonas sp. JS666]|uniref:hypothetical protein n=1 Tax=Polaromonas sp. (strain JS666 / ATCC BAA-500) TaxID=296591 RepID=UPI0000463C55|nr:hypothetical protein [Polaromonas sp. JS666]ABE42108.1 hypothetical protein Bpro_0143 [Polaromonas sp. JS666]
MSRPKPAGRPGEPVDPSAAGKGMPGKSPRAQRPLPDQPITPADRSVESSLELPHERDEAVDMTGEQTSPLIEQAERDVRKGLKDTSKAPEMDRAYKKLKS